MDPLSNEPDAVYVCSATWSGDSWIVQCDNPDVWTTSLTLARAAEAQSQAIAEAAGLPQEHVRVVLRPLLPASVHEALARRAELRETAVWANHAAAREARKAALELVRWGLSLRDIGWVLGVSHQRAHQLVTHKGRQPS